MSSIVFHIIEYITVKTSFFIIENTISIGYYIGSSAVSYIYSTVTNNVTNNVKNEIEMKHNRPQDIELDELKNNIIQLRSKIEELEKHVN